MYQTYKAALKHFNRQDQKTQMSILCGFQSRYSIGQEMMAETEKDFIDSVNVSIKWAEKWPDKYSNK